MRDENAEESADWFPLRIDCPPCGRRQCRDLPDLQHLRASFLTAGFRGFGCCGYQLPAGMRESDKLETALFTPSTKAELGDHDENISYEQSITVLEKKFPGHGEEYATKLRDYTIALYKKCAEYALSRGIIIADTKFEFGLDENGNVVLGDEMLTPDSSRFWPLEGYEAGHGQPSFDKQFVRNWLKANPDSNYDLPQDVIDKTIEKYLEAYEMLTGKKL